MTFGSASRVVVTPMSASVTAAASGSCIPHYLQQTLSDNRYSASDQKACRIKSQGGSPISRLHSGGEEGRGRGEEEEGRRVDGGGGEGKRERERG